jgi:basic membrane protein A
MRMKKFLSLMLALCMILVLAACGSSGDTTASSSPETSEAATDVKVAMITDYGDITDQSFNQTTYEASKAFCEENGFDFTYYKPAGDTTAERVAMIDKAVEDGYNVLVLPGYAFAGAIVETVDMYPDVKFVALDISQESLDEANNKQAFPAHDNLYCAIYQEELPGYMAGYAAVKMGYTQLGFLGGMAVPAVQRYGYGFVQGADAAAAETGAEVTLNYVYGNQFKGDADITAAMDTWCSGGTEVIFACGGGIYTSACEALQKTNGKVIGVDVNQSAVIDSQYGEGMTITSATKGLAATVNLVLTAIKDGQWDSYKGQVQNLGLVSADDTSLNYVGLPEDTTLFNDSFTLEDYHQLVADMVSGKITVSNDTSAEQPTAQNITVNFQGNIK